MTNFAARFRRVAIGAALVLTPLSALAGGPAGQADPANWPAMQDPVPVDPAIEARIRGLLARMSLEQKVGQVIQADVASVTPDDVARYHLGSILNGGNSAPGGRMYATAPQWLEGADAFHAASMRPQGNLPIIPIIWGSDAVHGHGKVIGATLFPHNIGLGAMRNPALMRQIGEVTAREMRVTGLDWTFAPTLAVVRNDRWGRSYEGFSEDPALVASYAAPLVEGLQGRIGDPDWLRGPHIIATAKHFVGDGGTTDGKDQGENSATEAVLRDQQAAGYGPALAAGVQVVMASYNSWQGVKMHGNRSLLTDVLKDRMGFGGFVVGDWNGHGQVPGCTPTDCPASMIAGLDMFMAPESWKALHAATLRAARDGSLPMARLEDAVLRILRVKARAGVLDAGRPSSRPFAGQLDVLGSASHRAIARDAVRQSLVLLKNEGATLPLKPGQRILIAGDGADSFMKQSGGWTLTWQGTGLKREDFPGATSIGQALVAAAGPGLATLNPAGDFTVKPDVAIVVFGEDPYAEFQGDVPDLKFRDTTGSLALLKRYRAAGIRTVAVFLSGRPMWINPHINASDAFVAAWLPGSEGGGVADILFGKADFRGTLSFSWPALATQGRLNPDDPDYAPLFKLGYGLRYDRPGNVPQLSETSGLSAASDLPTGTWFARGTLAPGLQIRLVTPQSAVAVATGSASTADGGLESRAIDRAAQEDARRFLWRGGSKAAVQLVSEKPLDLSRESNGGLAIGLALRVDSIGSAPVWLRQTCGAGCGGGVDIAPMLRASAGTGWQSISLLLTCLEKAGADMARVDQPLVLETDGALDLAISGVALVPGPAGPPRCG